MLAPSTTARSPICLFLPGSGSLAADVVASDALAMAVSLSLHVSREDGATGSWTHLPQILNEPDGRNPTG